MASVLDCIERIPGKLNQLAGSVEMVFESLRWQTEGNRIESLVFIASGSSYNAAFAAKGFLERECGLHAEFYYPNVFLNSETIWDSKALYVFISQGGSTRMVYLSAQKAKEAGALNCAITADPSGSPIGTLCHISISMGCGKEEFLYRTLGYSCTAADVCFLGLSIANKREHYTEELRRAAANLPMVEAAAVKWYQQHRFSLLRRNKAMLAGSGELWAVAQEADIKLMEMVPMMTRSYELEEFIHGPQNCFADDMLFFVLAKEGEDDEKAHKIARFLKQEIGFCALVGDAGMDERDLSFQPASRFFRFLEYITVFQVIAYRMAEDRGRDLTRGVNAQINQYITKVL